MSNNNYNFEGYDWSELAIHFGLVLSEEDWSLDEDIKWLESLQKLLKDSITFDGKNEVVSSSILDPCRAYLQALIERNLNLEIPMWKGLLRIEDPGTFIEYFSILLPGMWS